MINPSFEELDKINKSRYAIVIMIAKRAREINEGKKVLTEHIGYTPVTTAISEIMEKKVVELKDSEVE